MPHSESFWRPLAPWGRQKPASKLSTMNGSLSKMTESDLVAAIRRMKSRRSDLSLGKFARGTSEDLQALRDMDLLISGYEALLAEVHNPTYQPGYRGKQ